MEGDKLVNLEREFIDVEEHVKYMIRPKLIGKNRLTRVHNM
jgi:hypothetical protein